MPFPFRPPVSSFASNPFQTAPVSPAFSLENNVVLSKLSATDCARLMRSLTPCLFHCGQTLYESGAAVENVYFPKSGIISLVLTSQLGIDVEIGLIGRESVVGAAEALAEQPLLARATVQIAGSGWRISAPLLREVTLQSPGLSRALWRAAHALNQQFAQGALCNRLHSVDKRLARWLLMCHDRMRDEELELTHEILGRMLGTRRAGVTLACGELRDAGLIDYTRGSITILDRDGIEARACDCYCAIRQSYDALAAK